MSGIEVPSLIDFDALESALEDERKARMRLNVFSEDENFLRTTEEAKLVLKTVRSIQQLLNDGFIKYPSLMALFDRDFGNYREFVLREIVLEICFQDECFFPEKETHIIVDIETGKLREDFLQEHLKSFKTWIDDKVQLHEVCQKNIKEEFSLQLKVKDLVCACVQCSADYKTKIREEIFTLCMNMIDEAIVKMHEQSSSSDIDQLSNTFKDLQKGIEKIVFQSRFKLKRSTLSRLEKQVKDKIKSSFTYPSDLAKLHCNQIIIPMLNKNLRAQNLRVDIISESDWDKWFRQLSTNIWRGQFYIETEFGKLTKSLLALKRKDISAKILKEYLGEFWIHAEARKIKRKIVYHMGPTNSGKTYHAIQSLGQAKSGCYLAPLRLLAGELFDTLNEMGVKTTLLTGEEVIEVENSTHYSSTIEMARFQKEFSCAVIDEIQMISDPQRGWAWTRALVNIRAPIVHICGDPSVLELIQEIVKLCGDELEIKNYERMTELKVSEQTIKVGELEKNDALIVFSRKNALKYKAELERFGFRVSIVYGRLSPEVRREQARKFDEQETDIIVATDAIAMGMNLPIKRIVFSTITKHIDNESFVISDSEIKQIAGRAGRFGRFPVGVVTTLTKVEDGLKKINQALYSKLPQKTECMVGPDLDIFNQVNHALQVNSLPILKLSEFLRLFNAMTFQAPFFCVDLKEMIELAEMVEEADYLSGLTSSEIFGFACAPVNLGLMEHVQYYVWILNQYVKGENIPNEAINTSLNDIDYLETSIKCVELYQWLARHFENKNFSFIEWELLENKSQAVEKLNSLLSEKTQRTCASCGVVLEEKNKFAICEGCFKSRRFVPRRRPSPHGLLKSRAPSIKPGGSVEKKKPDFKKKKSKKKFWNR